MGGIPGYVLMTSLLDALRRDLLLAFRTLIREPGFTSAALLTFALCLAANVVIFSVVHEVLIKPLPFSNPDRLVRVHNSYPKANLARTSVSVPHYLERKRGVTAFENAAAYRSTGVTIGDAGNPERVQALSVTPSFFGVLQTNAALGRCFSDEEGFYGKNNVVMLSHTQWQQKHAGDPAVIGKMLRINGTNYEIIGILPPQFRFLNERPQVWLTMCFSDDDKREDRKHNNNQNMIARLRPGVSLAEAQAELDVVNSRSLETDPYAQLVLDTGFKAYVRDLQQDHVAELRKVLLLLQAGVGLLLLIGGVNLTNLLLVRTNARLKSLSVRQVLGAGRRHIAIQLSTEVLTLSFAGGLLGLLLGWLGLVGLRLGLGTQYIFLSELSLSPVVAGVGLLASLAIGVLLSLPVAWHGLQRNPAAALSVESRGGTTTRAAHRLRHGLIITQFALAFVLLSSAGVLGVSFAKVLALKPGFRPEQVLTGGLSMPWNKYKNEADRLAFVERVCSELEAIPGVKSATCTTILPFTNTFSNSALWVEGHEPAPGKPLRVHNIGGVSGRYFETMGFSLIEGRFLTPEDCKSSNRFCVIDEDMARMYWPGKSALGRRINNRVPPEEHNYATVVGVVGRVKMTDLADSSAPGVVFLSYNQSPGLGPYLAIRTEQEPEAVSSAVRAAVLRVDPEMPVFELSTMEERIQRSMDTRRLPMILSMIFSGVALFLAAIGIYGVLAYAVEQRRREIGVRMALGALPRQIRAQFLGLAGSLVASGLVLGVAGTWLSSKAMASQLYGTTPFNPLVLLCTGVLLATIALCACLIPSLRAARLCPLDALRGE